MFHDIHTISYWGEELFIDYKEIFNELVGLPHTRGHGHTIPVKKRAQPINLKPYMYSIWYKDMVEKMVFEMLELDIIQPSNNTFAFPMVLVKKKDGL